MIAGRSADLGLAKQPVDIQLARGGDGPTAVRLADDTPETVEDVPGGDSACIYPTFGMSEAGEMGHGHTAALHVLGYALTVGAGQLAAMPPDPQARQGDGDGQEY